MNTEQRMTEYAAQQAERTVAAAQLRAKHPNLVAANADKGGSLTAAAKNIRIELKLAFPAAKFSIRSSRYSGGDSVSVSWIDGPTTKQVEAIVNKYAAGSFDGMTDSYSYEHSAWCEAFGDAKYVQTRREYSDAAITAAIDAVCRRLGGIDVFPTVEDYRSGRIWNVRTSGGCDVSREVNIALSQHDCCTQRA